GLELLLDVDDHLRAAALALQGHGGEVLADVRGAGGEGVAAQLRDRGVQPEGLLRVLLVPGVAAVGALQRLRGERVLDVGAAAARALAQPVVLAGAGVDDPVRGVLPRRLGRPRDGLVPQHLRRAGLLRSRLRRVPGPLWRGLRTAARGVRRGETIPARRRALAGRERLTALDRLPGGRGRDRPAGPLRGGGGLIRTRPRRALR